MRQFLFILPALMCGGMMFVCFRMMFGSRKGVQGQDQSSLPDSEDEIKELREEVARLRADRDPVDG